jgi:hypothetical protein
MIVIVRTGNRNQLVVRILATVFLFLMFGLYYNHMSNRFKEQEQMLVKQLQLKHKKKIMNKSIALEKTIYNEARRIVKLLGQEHIQSIKVVRDKLLIVCDYDTNIEPLSVRYGVAAMVKNTLQDIKIGIDIAVILEKKDEA